MKIKAIKERAKHLCEEQLEKFRAGVKGNLLGMLGGKGIQKEEKKSHFEVSCYSFKHLYTVPFETLSKQLKLD